MNAFEKIIKRLEERKQLHERMIAYEHKQGTITEEFRAFALAEEVKKLIEIVNQVASEYGDGWIPCSKRLPDRIAPFQTSEYTVTMCFVKNGKKGRPFTSHASFDFESDKWLVKDHEVIAWREHIEPYKAESEE